MKTPTLIKTPCGFTVNESTEGETLEQQIERMIQNKEPIKEGTPLIYTEREAGVGPQYDIRTDRFEIAVEATSKIQRSYQSRREEAITARKEAKENQQKSAEPSQSTIQPGTKAPDGASAAKA